MDWSEYQKRADATSGFKGQQSYARLIVAALGLAGETGEVCDLVKKVMGHGHPLDAAKLSDEIGDALWYVAETASALGLDLGELAGHEVKYYGDGQGVDMHWLAVWALHLPGAVAKITTPVSDFVSDPLSKLYFYGDEREILGEIMTTLASIANRAGLSLDDIAAANLLKLAARYPEGFDSERSRARYDDPQAALEAKAAALKAGLSRAREG